MTSIRESIARLLGRRERGEPDQPSPFQAYTFYWTKEARTWPTERRVTLGRELEALMSTPEFEANPYERRYSVPGLQGSRYSGASLIALTRVLGALAEFTDETIEEQR